MRRHGGHEGGRVKRCAGDGRRRRVGDEDAEEEERRGENEGWTLTAWRTDYAKREMRRRES